MYPLLWIIVLCLNLSIAIEKPGPCSSLSGSVFVNEKCLKAFTIPLNWTEARDFCSSNLYSGKLAEPVTLNEMQAAVQIVKTLGQSVWLGASKMNAKGDFVWITSDVKLSSDDVLWSDGQPDDVTGDEDFIELLADSAINLNDASGSKTNPPLCELDILSHNVVVDPCYPWKNALFINGKCLKMFTSPLSWNNAKSFCGGADSKYQLVELFTEQQKLDAQSFGIEMNITSYWTGGRADQNARQQSFVWDSSPGKSIPTNLWEDDQPNNQGGIQSCVCMMDSGLLNDKECNKTRFSVCERNACNGTDLNTIRTCFSVTLNKLDMFTAQNQCQSIGARLAELTSYEKFQVLSTWLKGNETEFYIGADKLGGSFVWNVTKLPIRLNWWKDMGNISQRGDCVAMYSTLGKVYDSSCNVTKPFICQGEPRNPCDEIMPDAVYSSGYCFKYYDANMTWLAAQSYCLREKTHLAEPATAEMERNLTNYLSNFQKGNTSSLIWIGGTYMKRSGSFFWATNGDVITSTKLSQLTASEETENLVLKNVGPDFQWETRRGYEMHGFICQTAAVFDDPQQHLAVLPKMSHSGLPVAHLQVTAGYSFVVYVIFTAYIDGDLINTTTLPLAPKHDVQFDFNQLLILPYIDISSSYVLIESSQPVTVILYITDQSMNQSSSTVIFPVSIYQTLEADLSYVLISVFDEQPENMLSVVALSPNDTDVLLVTNNHGSPNLPFAIGQVSFTNFMSLKAILMSMYAVMTSSMRVNLNGAYLNSSQPVAVFLGSLGGSMDFGSDIVPINCFVDVEETFLYLKKVGWVGGRELKIEDLIQDSTMDQILPTPYIGSEYFVFPSDPLNSPTTDLIKCVALHDWTSIDIFLAPAIEVMQFAGDVLEIPFNTLNFIFVRGNASFYLYKINSIKSGEFQMSCITSILPSNAWRYQYDLVISSMLQSFKIIIYLVVETNITNFIEINNAQQPTSLTCTEITGTSYSGCDYLINSTTQHYYHIGLGNRQNKFGAYMYASNTHSAMCHPLGISDKPERITDAKYTDLKAYFDKLVSEQDPQPQTTCGPDITTSGNDVITGQTTEEDTHSTNRDLVNATQTNDFTIMEVTEAPTDVFVTTETKYPDESTDDQLTTNQSPISTNISTTLSQFETIEQLKDQITKTLFIDVQNTSSYRRTKISVSDERPYAMVAGSVGIAIIASVFSLICLGDVSYFVCFCFSFLKK